MHVARAVLCMMLAGSLLVPAQAPARAADVSHEEARTQLRKAFQRDFGRAFREGDARRIAGCTRRSRSRVACERIAWMHGDRRFTGRGQVWFTPSGGQVFRSEAYIITRYDTTCVDRTPENDCTRIFRAR